MTLVRRRGRRRPVTASMMTAILGLMRESTQWHPSPRSKMARVGALVVSASKVNGPTQPRLKETFVRWRLDVAAQARGATDEELAATDLPRPTVTDQSEATEKLVVLTDVLAAVPR